MVKKFTIPFASQGDANDIPDALQVDGKVSFTQGFGYDYERPYDDPQAKDIAREDMNGIFKAITSAVGELQTQGASEWSSAISYPKGAITYYEKDLYISQVDDNQNEPPQNWTSITSIANDSLKKAMNLADLTDKAKSRNNLGLGNSATLNKTDVLGTSTNLVATQKLVNDTRINLDNRVNAVEAKADNAQSRADSAYNLAQTKWDKQDTIGSGSILRRNLCGYASNVAMPPKGAGVESLFDPSIESGFYNFGSASQVGWGCGIVFKREDEILRIITDVSGHIYTLRGGDGRVVQFYSNANTATDKSGFLRASGSANALTDQNNQQIGVGQKWINVTSQRSVGTTYTNNTGKPIMIVFTMSDGEGNASIEVDGMVVSSVDRIGSAYTSVYAIVPDGSSYRATTNRSMSKWTELR